jgi:hypothetical protein
VAASFMSGGCLFLRRLLRCESDVDLPCLFMHGTYLPRYLLCRLPQERNCSRRIFVSTWNLI